MHFNNSASTAHLLKTQWGLLRVEVQFGRISSMTFEDREQLAANTDDSFRVVFMQWLKCFQDTTSDKKWNLLSPEGTCFQKSVWRTLLDIPPGSTASYKKIAILLRKSNASRAVGSAVAANPIALLIPCHRVVLSSGETGNYRWGPALKRALLEAESARNTSPYQLFQ